MIGTRLVPQLLDRGHEVIGTATSPERAECVSALEAEAIVLDLFDPRAVREAVLAAKPEAIVHEATALANLSDFKHFDRSFAQTNRLRTEGTDALLAAAREAGVRRFVAQSFASMRYAREGGPVKTEQDPLDPSPPSGMGRTLDAIRYLEERVLGADLEGIALRYGNLYGPGTSIATGGDIVEMVRGRRLPIVAGGAGIWSFIHVEDAASATLAAVERGSAGVYNVVDDDPARVSVWLPELARAVGAKPPLRIPAWLARAVVGAPGISMMTRVRGASNAKAKRELGWQPRYPSWREGFRSGLDGPAGEG